jgi:hypothetical protein
VFLFHWLTNFQQSFQFAVSLNNFSIFSQVKQIIRGGTQAQLFAERDRVHEQFITLQRKVIAETVRLQFQRKALLVHFQRKNCHDVQLLLDMTIDFITSTLIDPTTVITKQVLNQYKNLSKLVIFDNDFSSILDRMCTVFLTDIQPLPLLYDLDGLPRFQALFVQLYRQSDIVHTLVNLSISAFLVNNILFAIVRPQKIKKNENSTFPQILAQIIMFPKKNLICRTSCESYSFLVARKPF